MSEKNDENCQDSVHRAALLRAVRFGCDFMLSSITLLVGVGEKHSSIGVSLGFMAFVV